jgi:predicted DNA-binding mobile mystery protein A
MELTVQNNIARQHLDIRFENQPVRPAPAHGWIRAIRTALGMSTVQLARRMGVSQPSVVGMEQSESLGRIQLDTLHRAAEALQCRLVYVLVPNEPLESMVQKRARKIAEGYLNATEHSMKLEGQSVDDAAVRERQLNTLAGQISARSLWDEV